MTKTNATLTEGRLPLQMLLFSVPLIFSNLLQVLFNMADIAVAGRFAGAESLGAVGCTAALVNLFTGFLIGLSTGANVLVARYLGAKDEKAVRETVHTAALLYLLGGFLILLIGEVTVRPILVLMNTKDVLLDKAVLYLRIYFLGLPALAMYNFAAAVYSAMGNTRLPLICLSSAGALNLVLNLVFVIACRWDVAGVAAASAVSQYTAAISTVFLLSRRSDCLRVDLRALRLSPQRMKALLGIGIPAGFQHSIFYIANSFIQAGVNSFDAVIVEGNAAASNADGLVYDAMAAFYTAGTSFISQAYGAGKYRRVTEAYVWTIVYSFAIGLAIGLGLLWRGEGFLALFTTDAAVIAAGMDRLRVMGFSYCTSSFMDSTIAANRALGKTAVSMICVIMGSCVFRILWIYTVFAAFHTITVLYLLYVFSWMLTAAAEFVYFLHIRKELGIAGRR